jgi:hypothetical protein
MLLRNITILLLLFTVFCPAQTESNTDSSANEYSNEIQFYIFNQVIAAYKYNISENSGLRFRVNVTGLFNDKKSEYLEYNDPVTNSPDYHTKYSDIGSDHFFELNVHYLYSIHVNSIIHSFFGCGPFVNYDIMVTEGTQEYFNDENISQGTSYSKHKNYTWNLGISAVAGIECTVYRNLNLFTEYEAAFSKGWSTKDYYSSPNYYSSKVKYDEWNYELKGIRVGVGIYF